MHRFLLKCKTFKSTGQLSDLDRPDILCTVITKLDPQFQDRWTTVAERIERSQEREANFDDLLEFITVQSAQVSHPTYSRQALKSFKGLATRTTTTCNLCKASNTHSTDRCPVLLAMSLDDRHKKVFRSRLEHKCIY